MSTPPSSRRDAAAPADAALPTSMAVRSAGTAGSSPARATSRNAVSRRRSRTIRIAIGRDEDQREGRPAALRQQREAERRHRRAERERPQRPEQAALGTDADERPEAEHAERRRGVGIAGRPAQAPVEHVGLGRGVRELDAAIQRHEPRRSRDQPDHRRRVALCAHGQQHDGERGGVEERPRRLVRRVAGQPGPRDREPAPERQRAEAAERDQPEPAPQCA